MLNAAKHRLVVCFIIFFLSLLFLTYFVKNVYSQTKNTTSTPIEAIRIIEPKVHSSSEQNHEKTKPKLIITLIEAFNNIDEEIRWEAVQNLREIGQRAVPFLVEALKDEKPTVRLFATRTIGAIGPEAKAAIPSMIEALKDNNQKVQWSAAQALGDIGQAAMPALIQALKDDFQVVRILAAQALGDIGPEAIPVLIKALKDPSQGVRIRAMQSLQKSGSEARAAVPELVNELKYGCQEVRWHAARTLGSIGLAAVQPLIKELKNECKEVRICSAHAILKIGPEARAALPTLIKALKDEDPYFRSLAARALWEIGLEDLSAFPVLIELLEDKNIKVRLYIAKVLARFATILSDSSDPSMINKLRRVEKKLSDYPELQYQHKEVSRAIKYLKGRKPNKKDNLRPFTTNRKITENIILSIIVPFYILLIMFLLIIFRYKPLVILKINYALKSLDFKLPSWIGSISISFSFILFVGFLSYHPRVLDAWVGRYISICRKRFLERRTVSDRKIHISVPVESNSQTITKLSPSYLKSTFSKQIGCLLIWGEGGSGKTSLACQIAKWAMSKNKELRICDHLMLPVLIENDLNFEENRSAFFHAMGRQLQDLTDQAKPIPEELLEHLLRQRRILVIVDHLSEMSEVTRELFDPGKKDFSTNAFIVTSRIEENLGGISHTIIKPLRIAGNRLSSFMEAYLSQKGMRNLFDDSEFFDACRRLSEMVRDRDITILLAKLYADQLIAAKQSVFEKKLPDNVPDLMLSYLNELNRNVPSKYRIENPTIHSCAKNLAWNSLKKTYRPTFVRVENVDKTTKINLDYLENRLRLIETQQPAEDRIKFLLDPLAEYMAGLHLCDLYGAKEDSWSNFLAESDKKQGAPEAIKGFLLAVRDCILARGQEYKIPSFVANKLANRAGLDPEALKKANLKQRIQRLIIQVRLPEVSDRRFAAQSLREIGPEAQEAVPTLIAALKDEDQEVRSHAELALGEIGPGAVPVLIEALKDMDQDVRSRAANALGIIGSPAVPALIEVLKDIDQEVRWRAAHALGTIGSAAVPSLIEVLKAGDLWVRWRAAQALGEIGSEAKEAVPGLIEALKGEDQALYVFAAQALGKINTVSAKKALQEHKFNSKKQD